MVTTKEKLRDLFIKADELRLVVDYISVGFSVYYELIKELNEGFSVVREGGFIAFSVYGIKIRHDYAKPDNYVGIVTTLGNQLSWSEQKQKGKLRIRDLLVNE